MRTYKTLIWILIIFFFILPTRTMGQYKKLVYNPSKIELKGIKIYDRSYEKIVFENAFYNNEAGKPDLPVFYYKFYVPKGKTVTDVTFNDIEKKR